MLRSFFCVAFGACFLMLSPVEIAAQTPLVTAVWNLATNGSTIRAVSPGVRALIEYSPGDLFDNGSVTVEVGGRPAHVVYAADGVADVQIPVELTPGPSTVVIKSQAGPLSSFNIMLDSHSPGILGPLPAFCPARPKPVTLVAVGLGPTEPAVSTGEPAPVQPAVTVTKPEVLIAGRRAEVLESKLQPGSIGLYTVTVNVPGGLPNSEYHGVVLRIAERSSNYSVLSVGTTVISAASAKAVPAAGSIATAVGCDPPLADTELAADSGNLPYELGGTTVEVTDVFSSRPGIRAALYYVSPTQVNFVVPPDAGGYFCCSVRITSGSGVVSTALLDVEVFYPAVFRIPGTDIPAALLVRARDGTQVTEPVPSTGVIDMGPASDEVFLVLFGTGLGLRTGSHIPPPVVEAKIGRLKISADYAGAQGQFPGLDQINLRLSRALAGSGQARVQLVLNGRQFPDTTHLFFK